MSLPTVQHIVSTPSHCGGQPRVEGTRIRVWDIHVWHDLQRRSPAEIVADFPQLSLADVHAALAYYYDHRSELESEMRKAEGFASRLEAARGPTRYSQLRDQAANDDPLSPLTNTSRQR